MIKKLGEKVLLECYNIAELNSLLREVIRWKLYGSYSRLPHWMDVEMLTHIWPIILGRRKHRLLGKILADEKDEGAKYWLGPAGEGSSRGTMAQSAGNPKNPDPPQFIILPHHHHPCWILAEHYCAHITLAPLTVFQCSFKGNEHSVGICSVRFIVHHPPPPPPL